MAVARDASTQATVSGSGVTNYTFSHTCSGSNRVLFVGVYDGAGDTTTSVTYNSVAMTQIGKIALDAETPFIYVYGLVAPATGSNTVSITRSGTGSVIGGAATSYTGVAQTGFPDASTTNHSFGGTLTTTVTTVAANTLIYSFVMSDNRFSGTPAGTGTTTIQVSSASGATVFGQFESSSNPIVSPTAYSMTTNAFNGTTHNSGVAVSMAPFVSATVNSGFFFLMGNTGT